MSVTILINPISGGSRAEAARARDIASAMVERHGDSAEVFLTERPGHARELATSAAARGAYSPRRIQRATIECERPTVFHVDGETIVGAATLRARAHPGALRIAVR